MSFSFQQVTELKVGAIIWEGSQYGSIQFEVVTAPVVTDLGEGESKVEFTGKSLNEKSSREISYMLNSKYMHYGPKLYIENPYVTMAEIRALREFMQTPPGMLSSKSSHASSCNRQSGGSFCDCGFS